MSSRNFERWVSKLGIDERMTHSDEDFWALCPCHSDTKPSLHVYIGAKGNVVMNCFVCGAKGKDVCKRVGAPLDWLAADDEPDADLDDQIGEELARVTKEALERQTCKDEECGRSNMELEEILQMAADKVIARAKIASKGIEKGECVIADVIAETAFSAFKRMVADHYSVIYCRGRLGADVKPVSDQEAMAVAKEVNKRDI